MGRGTVIGRASLSPLCWTLGAAVLLCGCITPPVVARAPSEGWTLESSSYPQDARWIEISRDPEHTDGERSEPALRGYFFPSDEGAPVVVHFAESGGSLASSLHFRGQYHALAEMGFASLVVDYRGVGLSDGEPSPLRLKEDALDIWSTALWLVDGDPGRLIVRGASLGTVAISSLLREGLQPAACIGFAPVRPKTVARLYGYAVYWDPLVWLVAPFTRTFSPADPLEWFSKPGVPRLVVASPDDELLGERDFERLRRGVEASGGTVEVPEKLWTMIVNDDPVMKALAKHIALVHRSFSVKEAEADFLAEFFPSVPDMAARMDRIERLGSKEGVALVAADGASRERAKAPLRWHRLLPPDLVLAAASSLEDGEMEAFDGWFLKPSGLNSDVHEAFAERSFEELLPMLDLEDPGGRLPVELIVEARSVLSNDLNAAGEPRWNHARIAALRSAILGLEVPGQVFATGGSKLGEGEAWRFGLADEHYVPYAELRQSGRLYLRGLPKAFAADAEGRSAEEAGRRLERCLQVAAGLPPSPSSVR